MSPRSILKHSSSSYTHPAGSAPPMAAALPYPPQPQVHFPPPTDLARTHYTHSRSTYDRAPIEVMPNECAMPARGCRIYTERARSGGEGPSGGIGGGGKHPHPRVADATSDGRIPAFYGPLPAPSSSSCTRGGPPPLVPDISSESDESDGVVSPPPEYYVHGHAAAHGQTQSHSQYGYGVHIAPPSQEQLNKALAFLPHSSSDPKPPKREKERKRRCESTRFKSADASRSFASSSLDGCLGGF